MAHQLNRSTYRAFIVALIAANLVAWGVVVFLASAHAEPLGVVTRVTDGDTVQVTTGDRKTTVRILGIDTPETKKPRTPVQCWGPEATQYAKDTLLGERVMMVPDATQDATDRYGRILAYLIKPGGENYSVEAARVGAARSYVYQHHPGVWAQAIADAEHQAQATQAGLWGPPCWGHT